MPPQKARAMEIGWEFRKPYRAYKVYGFPSPKIVRPQKARNLKEALIRGTGTGLVHSTCISPVGLRLSVFSWMSHDFASFPLRFISTVDSRVWRVSRSLLRARDGILAERTGKF
jgi:hypothetical protein